MKADLEKLDDFNLFEVMHKGNLYRATLRKGMYTDYPFVLEIECVNMDTGQKHFEFSNAYKTVQSALNRMKKYFKGETLEWRRL